MVRRLGLSLYDKNPSIICNSFFAKIASKKMRRELNKLRKKHSTKAERRLCEFFKKFHIPFKTKVLIGNKEVDFLIGDKFVIEINGHAPNKEKMAFIQSKNYCIMYINNWEVTSLNIQTFLKQLLPIYAKRDIHKN